MGWSSSTKEQLKMAEIEKKKYLFFFIVYQRIKLLIGTYDEKCIHKFINKNFLFFILFLICFISDFLLMVFIKVVNFKEVNYIP